MNKLGSIPLPARLLVVDNDAGQAAGTASVLRQVGHAVDIAATGQEAMWLAAATPPDLILLEMELPDLDGREVCRRLKANPATANCFVVLCSAHNHDPDTIADGLASGGDDYIVRPVSSIELLARVRTHLRQHSLTESLRISEDRLRRAMLHAPFPAMLHAEDGEVLELSDAWCELSGYSRADLRRIEDWTRRAYGAGSTAVQGEIERIFACDSQIDEGDFEIQTASGQTRIWNFHSAPLGRLSDGRRLVLSTAIDDTTQRRSRLRHHSEQALLERIAHGDELAPLLQDLLAMIEQELPGGIASILHVGAEGCLHPHPGSRLPAAYGAGIEGAPIGPFVGSCGTAAFRREPVHVADIANDPLWVSYRQLALAHGLRACWSDPVLDADGAVLATFAVYFDSPRAPTPEQREALNGCARLASIALQRERRIARERALEGRLQHTLEHLSEGFFTLDRALRFCFINREALRLMQRPPEDLLGRGVFEVFPEARGTEYEHAYHQAIDSGRPVEFETFARSDGSWFEFRVYPIDDGLAIYFRNIGERKRTETALNLQASALQAAANAIVITNRKGMIEWANSAFYDMTGYSVDDALGRRPAELVKSGLQDEAFYRGLWDTISAGENWRGRIVNRYRDGSLHTEDMTITPVRDEHGEIAHFIAVKQDISERLALEQQLARVQRMESIGQLTGGVAHDFNNLLTVILGNAGVLSEQLPDDSPLQPLAGMVVSAAQRGAELTQRLLAFARKQTLAPSAIDVTALLDATQSLLRRSLGEHIDIEIRHAAGLPKALIDPGQLENAVLNLCLNARDAMPDGGRLMIETSLVELDQGYADEHAEVQPGNYVVVAISDTGCGIEPQHLGRVFEPFFTTKQRGKGTGLGLAMVYGFVKQSGGHATIYSEPGSGTTVKLFLPQDRGGSGTASTGRGPQEAEDCAVRGGSETILLVEDDPLVRAFANRQLAALGYTVLSASNGLEALEILRQRDDIALLFTDVIMPGGFNGPQLATAARNLRPALPVLLTSGYAENAIAQQQGLDPAMRLLSKPYRHAQLARFVREALDAAAPEVG